MRKPVYTQNSLPTFLIKLLHKGSNFGAKYCDFRGHSNFRWKCRQIGDILLIIYTKTQFRRNYKTKTHLNFMVLNVVPIVADRLCLG